jgi:threonine/homoserine/homoserine lactone efflux protein
MNLIIFLIKAIGGSLTGVLSPGIITAATISAGTRSRHAGALIAIGHGIVELPLMLMIMAGLGEILASQKLKIAIGLAGGAFLLWIAYGMYRDLKKPSSSNQTTKFKSQNPILIGIILTASNPLFIAWWASFGLNLTIQAADLGRIAFVLFAVIHWLLDLIWLEALSYSSFKGTKLFNEHKQRFVLGICTIAIFGFAVWFLFDASRNLINMLTA